MKSKISLDVDKAYNQQWDSTFQKLDWWDSEKYP